MLCTVSLAATQGLMIERITSKIVHEVSKYPSFLVCILGRGVNPINAGADKEKYVGIDCHFPIYSVILIK